MKLFLILASIVILSVIGIQESFADLSDTGTTETKKIITIVQKVVDGQSVIEQYEGKGLFYIPPPPTLEGCKKTAGWLSWNYDTQNSKIMNDLQAEMDTGKETLCTTILLPLSDESLWEDVKADYILQMNDMAIKQILNNNSMDESSKEYFLSHPEKYYPESAPKKKFNNDNRLERLDILSKFLEDNGSTLEQNRLDMRKHVNPRSMYLGANIPTSLIPELMKREDVVVLDVYGKMPEIPIHVRNGVDSKIGSGLQENIDSGNEIIPTYILLQMKKYEPSITTGFYQITHTDLTESEIKIIQKPIIELLKNNNMEIERISTNPNYINANVSPSLILELEKLDEVFSMDRSDYQITTQSNDITFKKTCNEELELIFKPSNNSPACVKPSTAEKLIQRGWTSY